MKQNLKIKERVKQGIKGSVIVVGGMLALATFLFVMTFVASGDFELSLFIFRAFDLGFLIRLSIFGWIFGFVWLK